MRKAFFISLLVAALARDACADFDWLNSVTNRITYASGGTNYLFGTNLNSNISCFVQLIYAGANKTNDFAVNTGKGTTNDDIVVATSWMGHNGSSFAGVCNGGTFAGGVTGGFYFVRAWTAPALDYTNGLVPTSPTNFYADSVLYSNACPSCVSPFEDIFVFGGALGFATTQSPIVLGADSDGDGLPDWWELQFFGSATGAVAGVDSDADKHSNYQEYIAGTDPIDPSSVLALDAAFTVTNNTWRLQWNSVAGRTYEVRAYTNLVFPSAATGWVVVTTNIAATPPLNTYTNVAPGNRLYFYGITVE